MKHEPPPEPLRALSRLVLRVMEVGGRFLLWLGGALVVIVPLIWLLDSDARDTVVAEGGFSLLAWAVILVGWHMVLTFLRWWIWWHEDEPR